jgi:hypothetical protein
VDVVGFSSAAGYARADVLPDFLTTAVREVGDALGLGDSWFADLPSLTPTPGQLLNAARWTRTHDPSPAFRGELRRILSLLDVEVLDGDL